MTQIKTLRNSYPNYLGVNPFHNSFPFFFALVDVKLNTCLPHFRFVHYLLNDILSFFNNPQIRAWEKQWRNGCRHYQNSVREERTKI